EQLTLDFEESDLGALHEHEPSGADARDLAAELRADRTAGAGDDDGLTCEVRRDRDEIHLDGLATEHVLNLDGPDLAGEVDVPGDQLVETGQRLDREA